MSLAIVFWYVNRFWFIKKKKRLIQEGQRIIIELLCKNWDKTSVYKWKNFYSLFFMYLCHCYTDRSRDWKIIEVHCCASVFVFIIYHHHSRSKHREIENYSKTTTSIHHILLWFTFVCNKKFHIFIFNSYTFSWNK
jgi:hypothetical protein